MVRRILIAILLSGTALVAQPVSAWAAPPQPPNGIVAVAPSSMGPTTPPLNMSGCNYLVCIAIQSYNGSGNDINNAQVWQRTNECLPPGTNIYLLYGPTTRGQTEGWVATVPNDGQCWSGSNFAFYRTLTPGWWLCGVIDGQPGEPCGRIG